MISLSEHNMSSYWSVSLLSSGPNRGLRAALRTRAAALTAYLTQLGQTLLGRWHFSWYWWLKKDAAVRVLCRRRDLRRWAALFCRVCWRTNQVRLNEPWRRPAGSHNGAGFLPDSLRTERAEISQMQKHRRRRAPVMDWESKHCCF